MSRKPLTCLVVAVTAATLQVTGCGKTPNQTAPPSHQHMTPPGDQRVSQEPASDLRRIHQEMVAALNLTDQQRTQIREIKARHRAALRDGQMRAGLEQMRDMVLAPTVDKAALVQALNAMHENKRGKIPHFAALLGDVREVLTPQQRTTATGMMTDRWDDVMAAMTRLRSEAFDDLSANLNMTPSQTEAYQQLRTADGRLSSTILNDAHNAIMQFMTDGNEQNLTTSLQTALANSRVADLVDDSADFVVSLTQTQRQQFVANYTSVLTKFRAMHRAMHADMGDSTADDAAMSGSTTTTN